MNRRKKTAAIVALALVIAAAIAVSVRKRDSSEIIKKRIMPHYGTIQSVISSTGTVMPQNRLEIKPTVSGRVESILVAEGQYVNKGRVLAWMSSTERAALIDAARAQGDGSLKYWEEAYRAIPIVAPINGTVIVKSVEPGQTVTASSAILVLSDRLIVEADVDETDIGRVKLGQNVTVSLDAYPDVKAKGRVNLIKYESKIVNNVTMYQVDIVPAKVPEVFRSGMTANVEIIEKVKERVLLLPPEAVFTDKDRRYVYIEAGKGKKSEKREVQTGLADDQNIEIISGLRESDTVLIIEKKNPALEGTKGGSPFMPTRKKGQ